MTIAPFSPSLMFKGGKQRIAATPSEYYRLLFDGWRVFYATASPSASGATRGELAEVRGEQRRQSVRFSDANPKLGPVTTDVTAVTSNVAYNGTIYNRVYGFNSPSPGSIPNDWPADMGEGLPAYVSAFHYGFASYNVIPRSMRVMCDGDKFGFYVNGSAGAVDYMVYIDGKPTSLTPYTGGPAGTPHFNTITFPSAKVRQIEIRTAMAIGGVYTQKPYSLWRPAPAKGPRVLVVGDSYTSSAAATKHMDAAYWNIGPHIGSDDVWVDHVSSSGYGVHSSVNGTDIPAGGPNRYIDRFRTTYANGMIWDIEQVNPEMVIVHGGGANDKFKGRSNAQVIADMIAYYQGLRTRLPQAKLVFVEGFAPPLEGFAEQNPNYIEIRTAVQKALKPVGVYYIDVATTDPWIKGTGFAGTGDATENSYSYISIDEAHPNSAGHGYIRHRLAPPLRRILADDGDLLNLLVR